MIAVKIAAIHINANPTSPARLAQSRLPPARALSEREISDALNRWHHFGDAAILRRSLVERGMFHRDAGVSIYRRLELAPPPEARALIRALHQRAA